nr:Gag-Pol polyprotein [Tanacetum cinerariifolium]
MVFPVMVCGVFGESYNEAAVVITFPMIVCGVFGEVRGLEFSALSPTHRAASGFDEHRRRATVEWSRFVTVVKQTVDLDKESYHKLFDILKQYQNEVNEICAEKIAKNANPLALVVFGNQKTVTVDGARETVGSQVVQQTGIQCFNYKEFRHFAKECRKPKRAKDYTYHKEKMLWCKQAKKGVPLQAEQADWLQDTDEEVDEQELEAERLFLILKI